MRPINLRNAKDYAVVTSTLFEDQSKALDKVCDWMMYQGDKPYFILAGYAGTGKTYLTGCIIRLAQQVCWNAIAATSPTHEAKLVLHRNMLVHGVNTHQSNVNVSTIHSFLGLTEDIDNDGNTIFVPNGNPLKNGYNKGCDLLVVDEGSQVGKLIMQYILDAQFIFQGRVLIVGDPAQIPPIGEKESAPFMMAVNGDSQVYGVHFLKDVVRQAKGSAIIGAATALRNIIEDGGMVRNYPHLLDFVDGDKLRVVRTAQHPSCLEWITSDGAKDNPKFLKFLAYHNDATYELNKLVRSMRLTPEQLALRFCVGESLILTEPMLDETQTAIVLPNNAEVVVQEVSYHMDGADEYSFEVAHLVVSSDVLEDGSTVLLKVRPVYDNAYLEVEELLKAVAKSHKKGSFPAKAAWMDYYAFRRQYVPVRHSYSLTTHRAQGSTYTRTIISEGDIFSNRNREEALRVAYTALTRASDGVIVLR